MEKVILELILAIREIKDILSLHSEEIKNLKTYKEADKTGNGLDDRLVKLALEGSKNLYMQSMENKVEKKLKELEDAVRELSSKIKPQDEIEVDEEHLNKLRKALAE